MVTQVTSYDILVGGTILYPLRDYIRLLGENHILLIRMANMSVVKLDYW